MKFGASPRAGIWLGDRGGQRQEKGEEPQTRQAAGTHETGDQLVEATPVPFDNFGLETVLPVAQRPVSYSSFKYSLSNSQHNPYKL